MQFYASKIKNVLGGEELHTEFIVPRICLNPLYPYARIRNPEAMLLVDSGAFQEREKGRHSFAFALERQLDLERRLQRRVDRIVAYDRIDDRTETLRANRFLTAQRAALAPRQIVLMVQGRSMAEYIACLCETLDMADRRDCIGFGGIAQAARTPSVARRMLRALELGLPLIRGAGVRDVHLFGVGGVSVLREAAVLLRQHGAFFNVSVDSSTVERNSLYGGVLDPQTGRWSKVYGPEDKGVLYSPRDLAQENLHTLDVLISGIAEGWSLQEAA